MDFSISNLWSTLMISCIGMALFMYGKKAARLWPLLAGIAMSIYPFFVGDWIMLWLITLGVLIALFFMRDR